MKKTLLFSNFFALLFLVFITASGQYTGGNPDVASGKFATASDSITDHEPGKAVDGLPGTYASIPGTAPAFWQVNLGTFYHIDGYGITIPNAGELPLAYTVQGSLNGSTWTDLHDGTVAGVGTFTYDFQYPDEYRYVRIYITSKDAVASITEVYVYGYEIQLPNPPVVAYEATDITSDGFTGHWSTRKSATGYYIHIATDWDFTTYVPGYEQYDVGDIDSVVITGLEHSTTYYYRISCYNLVGTGDPSNKVEVTTGKIDQTITFGALAAKTYGDADYTISATASSGLPVSFESSDASVATVVGNTVTIVGAGTADITATQEGDADYNPAEPVIQDLVVNPKELTVTGVTVSDKVYDGATDATLSDGTLTGVIGGDDVTLADATTGVFVQADVGTGIAVTTAMTITGADIDNYILTQPTDVTGNITPAELTVSGATAANKEYDGTTVASISGADLDGVIGADVVNLADANTGTFAQADVGTGIAVSTSMTLAGADAGNYTLVQPADLTADITTKDLTVTADDISREECGPNPDFTVSYSGFVLAEDESVLTAAPVASSTADESSPVGTYDITVTGGSADNYNFVYVSGTLTVTEDVTDPELTVQGVTVQLDGEGNASITAADVVASATDNCAVVDTVLSRSTFTVDDIGEVLIDVTITDAAGNSASEFAVVTVEGSTGIGEFSDLNASIFPNPTDGKVHLQSNIQVKELKVMDMTGKMIIKRSYLEPRETIDLSEYSNGVYIFQLQIEEELMHFRVVKN